MYAYYILSLFFSLFLSLTLSFSISLSFPPYPTIRCGVQRRIWNYRVSSPSHPFSCAATARPCSTLRVSLVITAGPTRTTIGKASKARRLRDPRWSVVQSWANMAVTRAYTMPWPPLLARLADDSSDADARRRDAKLSDADASPQIANTNAADADADAATVVERRRRRRRRRWRWRRRGGRAIVWASRRRSSCSWSCVRMTRQCCRDPLLWSQRRHYDALRTNVVWMIAMIETRNRVIPVLTPLKEYY